MAAFQKRKTEWTSRNKSLSNNRCLSISKLKILKNNITNEKLKEKKKCGHCHYKYNYSLELPPR